MQPPIKDQTDIGVDNPQLDASLPVITRQEDAADADIVNMLSKFGIVPQRGAPQYGIYDETVDLMVAIQSVNDAKVAYSELPEDLRKKFGSMEELLNAVENGSLVLKNENAPTEDKPPA